MVNHYGPLNNKDDVTPYLLRVADALEKGDITLEDAKRELEAIVGGPILATYAEQEREDLRSAYSRQFEQRDNARAQAQQIGNGNPAGLGNPQMGGAQPAAPVPQAAGEPNVAPAPRVEFNGDAARRFAAAGPAELLQFQAWLESRGEPSVESSDPKKRTLRPWHNLTSIDDDVTLHPVVRQTRQLVRDFTEDLEATKRDLLNTSNLPALPDSVWRSILKDEYVDLDKIFSAYNSSVDTRKRSEKIAEGLWLQTESDTPIKHIGTSTDWLVTFRTYMRGVLIAFPHRNKEFEAWEELVSTKFRVYNTTVHKRIIALEAVSRRSIFDAPSLCLLNTHVLESFVPAYLAVEGTEFSAVSGGASAGDRPRKKARYFGGSSSAAANRSTCNNWNSKGCTYNNCRHRHVCSNCGGPHTKRECTKTTSA